MNITFKQSLIAAGAFLAVLLAIAVAFTLKKNAYEKQIVELQNQVAVRDKTLEVKEGVYQKLVIQSNDLSSLLNDKNAEVQRLTDQLNKTGSQLLTANSLVVQLQKDLKSKQTGTVLPPDPQKAGMLTIGVDTKTDFDPFQVTGTVVGDCDRKVSPTVSLGLHQSKPLNISVVVSQDKDGTWRSSSTSSSEAFKIDIALAGVNPYLLEEKWYEKISVTAEAGVSGNPGLLFGGGINYEIGKFEVGPRVWGVLDHGASPYFGASLSWHPFKK